MPTIAYHTLGCKVNQYETEKMREALESVGFETVPFGSRADAYVINTCAVTAAADAKSRAAVRRAVRLNPQAYVVVAGCCAELESGHFGAIEGVDLIVPNKDKHAVPELVAARFNHVLGDDKQRRSTGIVRPRVRTRAIVKVQDGCDHFCSYCIVPFVRPGRRSRPMSEVLGEIEALAAFGYKEIVLAGIRLGSYSDGPAFLPDLILRAAAVQGVERLRLSSVEPWEVDEALIDAVGHPKVCRHLHIPLQSGDDAVLERMNRPYTGRQYLELVRRIREKVPGIGITTDVMVGFPGESERAFENTCTMIEEAGFSRLHVFRYSPRKMTRAAQMPDQIDEGTKKARSQILAEMGKAAVRRFAESFVGRALEVLVERRSAGCGAPVEAKTSLAGFADNYVEVRFSGDASLIGRIVTVEITGVDKEGRALGSVSRSESPNGCGGACRDFALS